MCFFVPDPSRVPLFVLVQIKKVWIWRRENNVEPFAFGIAINANHVGNIVDKEGTIVLRPVVICSYVISDVS